MQEYVIRAEAAIQAIEQGAATADSLETTVLDFKEEKGSQGDFERVYLDAAICFANTAGGVVVLGVADRVKGRQAFTGISIQAEQVRQHVYELTRPHLTVDVFNSRANPSCLIMSVPQSADFIQTPKDGQRTG